MQIKINTSGAILRISIMYEDYMTLYG